MNGRLIVIEGIDGTGKSTQIRLLAEWLEEAGQSVVTGREPTNGPHGRTLRLAATSGRLAPADELTLFELDRREHVETVIAPALAAGKTVILDRYYFSTMAYQGARGFDPATIRTANETFAPVPDLLLVLDLDVTAALARIGRRGDRPDHYEGATELTRCREIFLSLAAEPFARIIPAEDSPDAVQSLIRATVAAFVGLPSAS